MRDLLIKTLVFVMTITITAQARSASRANSWEFFLTPQIITAKSIDFGNGATADLNDRSSLGIGFGYNLDDHIELTLLFDSSSSNYTGTRVADDAAKTSESFTSNLYTSTFDFGLTYNLLESPFTPYVSLDFGSTYMDSGIATGDSSVGCYWHPWYGYICTPVDNTYTDFRFHYGASVGLRYDLRNKIYFKGNIGKKYVDVGDDPGFTVYQLIFGAMF